MGRHSLRESEEPASTGEPASSRGGEPAVALLTPPRSESPEHTQPIPIVTGGSPAAPGRIPTQRHASRSLPLPIVSTLEPDEWFRGFEEPSGPRVPSDERETIDSDPSDTIHALGLGEPRRPVDEIEPADPAEAFAPTEPDQVSDALEPPIRVVATPVGRITPLPRPTEPADLPLTSEAPTTDRRPTGERGPRLLLGGQLRSLAEHTRQHGELPRTEFAGPDGADRLLALVERSGLRGRGGAGFPTARKMMAVRGSATPRRRPVVVANGCEGDPTSAKDELLLHGAPHLVLDGIALAAHAVGADQAILCLHRGSPALEAAERAIAERNDDPCELHIVTTPTRFVSSEASALVNFLTSGDARPTTKPPRTSVRGVQGRPTLVDNVETLAHLALLARRGADWFRARGTDQSPGTMLVTLDGVVHRPGVYEVDMGTTAGQLIRMAGGTTGRVQAMLLGGFGGTWLSLPSEGNHGLSYEKCREAGTELGVASLVALPTESCGLGVTSAILDFLASESAGQCGPCMFGLPALAQDFQLLAAGRVDAELTERMRRRINVICGRGACSHPDGALRLAASALRVFSDDVAHHLDGQPCGQPVQTAFAPLDELPAAEGGWR